MFDFLQQDASNRLLLEEMNASFSSPIQEDLGPWRDRVREKLLLAAQPVKVIPFYKKWWPSVVAAVLLLVIGTLGWQYYHTTKNAVPPATLAAIRPDLDGEAIMRILGLKPGPVIGEAYRFLMEIRLDEGSIGPEEAERRLRSWFADRTPSR